MKRLITFAFLSISIIANGQSSICPSLKSLEGEWQYTNGQDTIRICLRYKDCIFNIGENKNILANLWGWHEYKVGNTVKESNYSNRLMNIPSNYDSVILHSYSILLSMPQCDTTKHSLRGYIDDISQCYESHTVTIQFNSSLNQITWQQEHSEGYGFISGCKGMTLPKYFILTKL